MVRISVDQGKCAGHARCFATAPEVYPIDDELAGQARLGAAACPERAITLLG